MVKRYAYQCAVVDRQVVVIMLYRDGETSIPRPMSRRCLEKRVCMEAGRGDRCPLQESP